MSAEARVSQNLQLVATQVGLEASVPLPLRLEKSGRIFKLLAARCGDFGTLGRAMAWMVLISPGWSWKGAFRWPYARRCWESQ